MSSLIWDAEPPPLRRPIMVAGFTGWNDAGDAASDSIAWLSGRYGATRVAHLDAEQHIDFQAIRPTVELIDGVTREVRWPTTAVSVARTASGPDLVLVTGPEPNYRWRACCEAIVEAARTLGCTMVVTLGALLADVAHTQPVRITGSTTDPALTTRMGITRSRYEGPTGIVGVLHDYCRREGVPSASLWAPVPHYAAAPPNPPAIRELLARLADVSLLPVDLSELDTAANTWRERVDEAIAGDDDLRGYVAELERQPADEPPAEHEIPSGDALAEQFQRYLEEHGQD